MNNPFEAIMQQLGTLTEEIAAIRRQLGVQKQAAPEIGGLDLAVAVTGLARQTIYQFVSNRAIPHYKRGKKLYFKREELEKWILERKVSTASETANAFRVRRSRP